MVAGGVSIVKVYDKHSEDLRRSYKHEDYLYIINANFAILLGNNFTLAFTVRLGYSYSVICIMYCISRQNCTWIEFSIKYFHRTHLNAHKACVELGNLLYIYMYTDAQRLVLTSSIAYTDWLAQCDC